MAGKMSRRSPPEDRAPTGSKSRDIETAQSRNLDVELYPGPAVPDESSRACMTLKLNCGSDDVCGNGQRSFRRYDKCARRQFS
jgi:hypothetical protein